MDTLIRSINKLIRLEVHESYNSLMQVIMIEEGGSCIGQLFLRADLSKGLRFKGGGIPFTSDWHGASTWKQKQNSKVFMPYY